jgi:hypothetical protein
VSTWKEALRIATLTTTNRCVLADTYIGGQILLKKGGIIQILQGPSTRITIYGAPMLMNLIRVDFCHRNKHIIPPLFGRLEEGPQCALDDI